MEMSKRIFVFFAILGILLFNFASIGFSQKEAASWKVFQYKDWDFSMEIHPDFIKKEERSIDRERIKAKTFVYSNGNETITIIIDQSQDVKTMRSYISKTPKMSKEALEKSKNLTAMVFPETALISQKPVNKNNCIGIEQLYKKGKLYEQSLYLTSKNIKDMYLTISFEYYTKNTATKVKKMIETIKCSK